MKKIYFLLILVIPFTMQAQRSDDPDAAPGPKGPIIGNVNANVVQDMGNAGEVSNPQSNGGTQSGGEAVQAEPEKIAPASSTTDNPISDKDVIRKITENLKLYPNPATAYITVDLGIEQNVSIKVVNIIGGEVYSTSGMFESITIDLTNLPPGAYFLTVQKGSEMLVRRIEIS